jgi:hypothetical protein
MDIATLYRRLETQASGTGKISLDTTILSAAETARIQNAFGLPKGQYLTINGVRGADVTRTGDAVKISAGTVDLLNRQALGVQITFTVGSQVDFVLAIAMPEAWALADSFSDLPDFPFKLLALSDSYFIYSTRPVNNYPLWSGRPADAVDLTQGLNFGSDLSVDALNVLALLLGPLKPSEKLKLRGSFEAPKPKSYPVMSLNADLNIAGFDLLPGLTVKDLRLTVQITEPASDSVQDVVIGVGATTKDLEFLLGFTENTTAITVSGKPLPTYSATLDTLAECTLGAALLPQGTNFSSFLPAPISDAFASIQFNGFAVAVSLTPTREVTYLSFSVGEKPGSLINLGLFDLTGFTLNAAWVDLHSPEATTMIGLTAQARMPLKAFPDPFDFSISISNKKGWAIDSVDASYQGAVTLSDIVKEVAPSGTVIPAELNDLTFSDFLVHADPAGETFSCSCHGAFQCAILSRPFDLSFCLTLTAKKTNNVTEYAFDLSAGLIIGETEFLLVAELAKSGGSTNFQFTATADEIPLSDLIVSLFKDFDLDLSVLPEIALSQVTVSYNTPTDNEVGVDAIFTFADTAHTGEFILITEKRAGWEFAAMTRVGGTDPIDLGSRLPLIGKEFAGEFELKASYLLIASKGAAGITLARYPDLVITPGVSFAFDLLLAGHPQTLMLPLASFASSGGTSLSAPAASRLPAVGASSETGADAAPGTISIQKKIGPIFIESIGISYESQILACSLNASVAVGPLSASLSGLSFGSSLTAFKPSFGLHGLGVSYSEPPLTIAGELVNLAAPGDPYVRLEGGLVIGTGEFTVSVFGYYGDESGFNSMFIFGDIAYDFGGPPAFFVTGLALGFGYNSEVTVPTIDEVATFPFIQVLPTSTVPNTGLLGGPNASPLDVLNKILDPNLHQPAWVHEEKGSLWLAAGITFTSFALVNSQALLMVDVGSELVIALVGVSRAQFPQAGGETVYANIELDLLVRFAPSEGIFSAQAVLASSSYLLDQACVLTGGFAFFVWYDVAGRPDSPGSKHAGDFVLTLGGYHPGFTPPAHYPQVPPVGFHWAMDSTITIQGGAYFALTPAALMVGGNLQATYQSGHLQAWFDAHADVIIRWKPFWFDADIGLTLGASYTIDWGFTTSTITVEVGCDLEFWGPPTGGSVTLDLYVISVTIPFGTPKNNTQQVKGWADVGQMLPNTGSEAAPNVLKLSPTAGLTPGGTAPHKSRAARESAGMAPADSPPDGAPWVVRGSMFSFSTSSSIPATTATVGEASFTGHKFNVYPLSKLDGRWNGVGSALAVNIRELAGGTDFSSSFEAVGVWGGVPAALWGSPPEDSSGEPQVPDAGKQLVPDQLTGLSVRVKAPQVGRSAGPINVQTNLEYDELRLESAVLPLSGKAAPTGDIPANSTVTVSTIVKGIASEKVAGARAEIFRALRAADYAPDTNDPMTRFRDRIGCSLNAEPLLVNG